MKEIKIKEILGLWASETHYLIIRENIVEYCVKNENPDIREYPNFKCYPDKISISDSISIQEFTYNSDDVYFEIKGRILQMHRMHS